MYPGFFAGCKPLLRKSWSWMLAFVICFGLLSGIYVCNASDADFSSWMDAAAGSVSIVGSAFAVVFPLLLTICFVFTAKRWFILLLASIRAFLLGYCIWGIFVSCGSGGWLLSYLYFFVSISMFPADVLLWLRCCQEESSPGIKGFLIYLIFAAVTVALNHRIIGPFLLVI